MTEDDTARLAGIFAKVFPGLPEAAIQSATSETVAGWDSFATLTLFTLAGEAFGIKLAFDRIGATKSFAALAALIERKRG